MKEKEINRNKHNEQNGQAEQQAEQKDKNLKLANKRTRLAAKRTLLSFIRTALLSLSVALAFIKLDKHNPIDGYSIALLALSAIILVVGIIHYAITLKHINNIFNT